MLWWETELDCDVVTRDRAWPCFYDGRQSSTAMLRWEIELDRSSRAGYRAWPCCWGKRRSLTMLLRREAELDRARCKKKPNGSVYMIQIISLRHTNLSYFPRMWWRLGVKRVRPVGSHALAMMKIRGVFYIERSTLIKTDQNSAIKGFCSWHFTLCGWFPAKYVLETCSHWESHVTSKSSVKRICKTKFISKTKFK